MTLKEMVSQAHQLTYDALNKDLNEDTKRLHLLMGDIVARVNKIVDLVN